MTEENILAPFKAIYDKYVLVAESMGNTVEAALNMQSEINYISLREIIQSNETAEEKAFALECWAAGFYEWQVAMIIYQAMEKQDDI